jgi:hypothetical protein
MVPNRVSAAGVRLPSPKLLSRGLGPNPTVMIAVARGHAGSGRRPVRAAAAPPRKRRREVPSSVISAG